MKSTIKYLAIRKNNYFCTILSATTDTFYGASPEQCETFYPTCDQSIEVEKGGDAEEGQCVQAEARGLLLAPMLMYARK